MEGGGEHYSTALVSPIVLQNCAIAPPHTTDTPCPRGIALTCWPLACLGWEPVSSESSPLPEYKYLPTYIAWNPSPGLLFRPLGPKVTDKGDTVGRVTLPHTSPP